MNLEDKLRFRTDRELKLQEDGLIEVSQILRNLDIPFFLAEGTLLGAARDRAFIRWDWDVGISLLAESSLHRLGELGAALAKKGFAVDYGDKRNPKLNARKYGTKYELSVWQARGKMMRRRGRKIPKMFFDTPGVITLYGQSYPCPSPVEQYLEFSYGFWQKPVRSANSGSNSSKTLFRRFVDRVRALGPGKSAMGELSVTPAQDSE